MILKTFYYVTSLPPSVFPLPSFSSFLSPSVSSFLNYLSNLKLLIEIPKNPKTLGWREKFTEGFQFGLEWQRCWEPWRWALGKEEAVHWWFDVDLADSLATLPSCCPLTNLISPGNHLWGPTHSFVLRSTSSLFYSPVQNHQVSFGQALGRFKALFWKRFSTSS